MLYLIVGILTLALAWLGHRHFVLNRGVRLLAQSVRSRRAFLDADPRLGDMHSSWRNLAREASAIVSELARLSHQQADQLAQLEATLGSLQEAVLIVDRDNYILLANPALRRLFPAPQELAGQRLESVLRSAKFLGYLERVRSGESPPQTEIEFVESDRSIWLETTGTVIPGNLNANGPWVLFVLHDVTRQKLLEAVRRDFVANVSHELKTPLSVIKGYTETLVDDREKMTDAEIEQFIRTIHRHSERLSAIVDDLLTLSQLENSTSGPGPKLERRSLNRLVGAIAEEFAVQLSASGHRLSVRPLPQDIDVEVDLRRIHQVFGNLAENAQKYTPAGTCIEFGLELVAGEVRVWVCDDGPGIPAADLPRIFERFYRVEKGRSRGKGGTGLGLSIVKHIVQMHGGRVWAESEAGRGLKVVFTLVASTGAPFESREWMRGEQSRGAASARKE